MFRNLGVKLTSLKQPVDLDTAFGRFVPGTHACTAELERDLIKQRQAEGIAVKRSHGGNVGGRPRIADVKADAAVKLYLARETPIPDICAATGISNRPVIASSVNADWWASGNEPVHRFAICLISSSAAALLYKSAVFLQLKPCVNA